jgi:archaellum component FlaC
MASDRCEELLGEINDLWYTYMNVKKRITYTYGQFERITPDLSEPLKILLQQIEKEFDTFVEKYEREIELKLSELKVQLEECD